MVIVDVGRKNVKPAVAKPTGRKQANRRSRDPTGDTDDGNDEQGLLEQTILIDAEGNIIG